MREIEFRGKASNGEWVCGGYVQKENAICPTTASVKIYVDPNTVGQYTGLRDIGGVKIFEGDIALYDGKKHEVLFDDGSFFLNPSKKAGCFLVLLGNLGQEEVSVIGNIHDNPELLEAQNDVC